MFSKVVYMCVFVGDQDRALAFYVDVLGFEKRVDNPSPYGRFVGVGLAGQDLMVVLCPGTPGRGAEGRGAVPGAIVVETAGCRAAVETLKARGVALEMEPTELPFGLVAIARDLDGNRIQIVERPAAR